MNNKPILNSFDFDGDEPIIGMSSESKEVQRAINKLSNTGLNLMIIGEAGTGKKFLTQKIFNQTTRYNSSFVRIDCAALGKTIDFKDLYGESTETNQALKTSIGLLERSNNGILLLENIGLMNYEYQEEFLRILKDKTIRALGSNKNIKVDFRIISTAEGDLLQKVETGQFKRELYIRLKALVLKLPPLRERKQDIPQLFNYFLKKYSNKNGFKNGAISSEIFESILAYHWKGNIGELRTAAKNLITKSSNGELEVENLPFRVEKHPFEFLEPERFKQVVKEVQIYLIEKALRKFNGNQVKTAVYLNIPEATLRFKIKTYQISRHYKN